MTSYNQKWFWRPQLTDRKTALHYFPPVTVLTPEAGFIMYKIICLTFLKQSAGMRNEFYHSHFFLYCVGVCVYNTEWDNARHIRHTCCYFHHLITVDLFSCQKKLSCTVTNNIFHVLYIKAYINPVTTKGYLFIFVFSY